MEDSSRTYDSDGNRTDNVERPRNISESVRAEIAARRTNNNGAARVPVNNADVHQAPIPEAQANQAAPSNNIPSPSPTGVNTFFTGSRSPNRQGNISAAPGFIPPGFEPAANPQPAAAPQANIPTHQAAPAVDFAAIMAQVTQQLSTSLQTMQQQLARENEENIKRQFQAIQGKIPIPKEMNQQPPLASVHITENSSSKKSYASASKAPVDDETFDSSSKNTTASSTVPSSVAPAKRGIPAPMASSIPVGTKGPALPEKLALCVKAISYVGNIKHARAESDTSDICFGTLGRAFVSALELVDPSKTYTLLSAYELKPGDRTNTKPDNIKRQGQFVVKFEAEFNNPDGNIKPSDASSNKLFMVTTSNTSTTIHPGSKPSLLKLILSTIQNTQFVDSFLE
jgi:hypothetical protein